jgi:hypothetical protein
MSSILVGWDDDRVIRALEIVRDTMTDASRLLIIDALQPQCGDESPAARSRVLEDLNMLVRTGGRGRRESELRDLCGAAGLRVTNVQPLAFASSMVEVRR